MHFLKTAREVCSVAALTAMLCGTADQAWSATIYGLTDGNRLVVFDSGSPGTIANSFEVSGVAAGQTLVGIDFRPATSSLVGVARDSSTGLTQVYTLSSLGAASAIGGLFALTGSAFGVDFNPVPNALRIVSDAEENRRITMGGAGVVNSDTALSSNGGADPGLRTIGAAYGNNVPGGIGGVTTLYVIDATSGNVFTQGGLNSSPSPNLGQLMLVGSLGLGSNLSDRIGFDILGVGTAFASVGNNLYSVNLSSGAATLIGGVALPSSCRTSPWKRYPNRPRSHWLAWGWQASSILDGGNTCSAEKGHLSALLA
jgi:hypothetical protein